MKKKTSWLVITNAKRLPKKETMDLIKACAAKMGAKITFEHAWGVKKLSVKNPNLIISLGGDASLLYAAKRRIETSGEMLLGINTGHLGFHTACHETETDKIDTILQGHYSPQQMNGIEVKWNTPTQAKSRVLTNSTNAHGLNDCWLERKNTQPLHIDASINCPYNPKVWEHHTSYHADGLIVCSGVGSTAYNFSANGPLLHPRSEQRIITPICPMSLCQRSTLIESNVSIQLRKGSGEARLMIDGQYHGDVTDKSPPIIVSLGHTHHCRFPIGENPWKRITEKLNWGKPKPTDTR